MVNINHRLEMKGLRDEDIPKEDKKSYRGPWDYWYEWDYSTDREFHSVSSKRGYMRIYEVTDKKGKRVFVTDDYGDAKRKAEELEKETGEEYLLNEL